jgi:hypothetical protein
MDETLQSKKLNRGTDQTAPQSSRKNNSTVQKEHCSKGELFKRALTQKSTIQGSTIEERTTSFTLQQ